MPNPNRLRCPNCRTRRTDSHSMFLHLLQCKQENCDCGGYHFRHRKGSRMCYANDYSDLRHAVRRGESDHVLADIAIDIALDKPGRVAMTCPF